tara:strand:- start:830 stop:2062 length:1233 start_codon:yes stop_codon:yes gene_type:complete
MKIQPVRGTHDVFGKNISKYNKICEEVDRIARLFSFLEIQTPIFESTNLFSKPLGEASDVVLKEMYTFLDKSGDSLTLRPEYTTPIIRAAISNNLINSLPCKLFGIGPMFRRERPQKGRYRQFSQINFENFGTEDTLADVELIHLANKILKSLLPNIKINLYLNSLGDKDTLKIYKNKLSIYFKQNKRFLSKESQSKVESNPIRILDSKISEDKNLISKAPLLIEFLSKDALRKYEDIKKLLKKLNINYFEDNSLVRGLDYYCHTVFEFKTSSLGSQDTLIGGGRYDGLIKSLGGKDIPGIGWAGGIERIILLMNNVSDNLNLIHFAILHEKFKEHALLAYNLLIDNNYSVYWNFKYNLKKSLSKASESKARFILIIGEEEFKIKKFKIKDLKTGHQKLVNIDSILKFVK